MEKFSKKAQSIYVLLFLAVILFSCHDDWEKDREWKHHRDEDSESTKPTQITTVDLQGRALASNCFQCHGTNGYAGELKIAGQGAGGIIDEFREMQSESPGKNIMNVHARAYTDEEIRLIADYISKQ